MLFPYQPSETLTPLEVKQQKEALKQYEFANFAQYAVTQLIENRTQFCDDLLVNLWQSSGLDQYPELSLIAVGGYGRAEMFPLSDLDFLILTPSRVDAEVEQKIRQFVQFLWDCNFDVGQAVRTLEECLHEGRADISVATNLLESRFLCGNHTLFEQLNELIQQLDFWSIEAFFNAKVQEKIDRYQRYNNTSYNLEPDLKYSPGGLRDLHLLYWLALRHTGAKNLEDILHSGFIYPEEYWVLQESQLFLFKVRFALHLILRRYDNRLLFDRQVKISELLGYQGSGNQAVENMMKAFFQALQSIAVVSDILVKHYREHFLDHATERDILPLDENFRLIDNAICLRREDCFLTQPDSILDLFYYLTLYTDAEIHSATLRKLCVAVETFEGFLSELPLAREKFLRLLAQPKAIQRALLPMHQYGVLSIYLPQWQGIKGLMQFDLFHIYTVDEHTLRVMLKLEQLLNLKAAENYPIYHRIFSQFIDRTLLYVVALFHDIAKGRGGDHSQLGAQDIAEFAQLHGFDRRETDTMQWLVANHLLMSITAQRRDIHDPEVVMSFAEQVQNQVRLDYLACLTMADINATNETLWNSWKASLLSTLYQYTHQQFQQGMDNLLDNQEKIRSHRQQALALLSSDDPPLEEDVIMGLWKNAPDDYFLRNTPAQIAWHTQLLSVLQSDCLVKISNRFSQGGTEIFVYCQDQPNLFNKVVNTIGAKRFSIHDAQIITGLNGFVLDSFIVTELNGELVRFDRRRELEAALMKALQTEYEPNPISQSNRQLQHFHVKTEMRFLNTEKKDQTEMELFALDQAGLLAKISQVFSELGLNLLNAKISTIGEKAEDFFILTNQAGQALNAEQREQLQAYLYLALGE
ncbi:MAG: bifunctional uridylyltransferase/uridylyl-removing protein GlnD [[Pasteurella] mairii]|nr:bifunctional uridylyltransferase/uridylyl-removing protein GlnD [[Pasteurella] mairii]